MKTTLALIIALVLCINVKAGDFSESSPLDSVLYLKYNPATYKSTLQYIAKYNKPLAQQTDSAINYINALPGCWGMSPVYKNKMLTLTYRRLPAYAKLVKLEYTIYENIEDNFNGVDYPMSVDKPVIYLYPEKEANINVTLNFKSGALYTWPKVDNALSWSVTAQPNGMLKDATGEEYPYLFWESETYDYSWVDRSEGFVVEASNTENFLLEKLKLLGLNSRERTDFITFWAPKLVKNKYNFIRFETAAYDKQMPLNITPKPESIQRILMVYKPLEEKIEMPEQTLQPFTRKGFTVIEWGGSALPEIVN